MMLFLMQLQQKENQQLAKSRNSSLDFRGSSILELPRMLWEAHFSSFPSLLTFMCTLLFTQPFCKRWSYADAVKATLLRTKGLKQLTSYRCFQPIWWTTKRGSMQRGSVLPLVNYTINVMDLARTEWVGDVNDDWSAGIFAHISR